MVRKPIVPWAKIRGAENECMHPILCFLYTQANLANLTSVYMAFQLDFRGPFKFTKTLSTKYTSAAYSG